MLQNRLLPLPFIALLFFDAGALSRSLPRKELSPNISVGLDGFFEFTPLLSWFMVTLGAFRAGFLVKIDRFLLLERCLWLHFLKLNLDLSCSDARRLRFELIIFPFSELLELGPKELGLHLRLQAVPDAWNLLYVGSVLFENCLKFGVKRGLPEHF